MKKSLHLAVLLMVVSLFALGLSLTTSKVQGAANKAATAAVELGTDATGAATAASTPAPLALGNGLTIENKHSEEHVDKPGIEIEIDKPVMRGAANDTVKNFNKIMDDVIENSARAFTDETVAAEATATLPPDIPGGDNFISVDYQILNGSGKSNIVSLKFNVAWYSRGAAHPNSYSVAVNYDLNNAKQLALAELFKPKSAYLDALSKYTMSALKAAGTLDFPEGAEPLAENFRSWNITPVGLQINFDDYQVTSHAAGPQTVIVPYTVLKSIIDPAGPLAEFMR